MPKKNTSGTGVCVLGEVGESEAGALHVFILGFESSGPTKIPPDLSWLVDVIMF